MFRSNDRYVLLLSRNNTIFFQVSIIRLIYSTSEENYLFLFFPGCSCLTPDPTILYRKHHRRFCSIEYDLFKNGIIPSSVSDFKHHRFSCHRYR